VDNISSGEIAHLQVPDERHLEPILVGNRSWINPAQGLNEIMRGPIPLLRYSIIVSPQVFEV
jgi:hypothetical protein